MAAYIGPELLLEQFLFAPSHNLVEQAWRPREMTVGHLNADGYGLSWYNNRQACRFVSPFPIWSDTNLPALGRSLRSTIWLGAVRGASPGFPTHPTNTQPFVSATLSFLHNGHIDEFGMHVRGRMRALLDPLTESSIEGTTDSEYLFALLRRVAPPDATLEDQLRALARALKSCLGGRTALVNLLVSDGDTIAALRHASSGTPPSLYYTEHDPQFPDGTLICSEPMTDAPGWRPVPPQAILTVTRNQLICIRPL